MNALSDSEEIDLEYFQVESQTLRDVIRSLQSKIDSEPSPRRREAMCHTMLCHRGELDRIENTIKELKQRQYMHQLENRARQLQRDPYSSLPIPELEKPPPLSTSEASTPSASDISEILELD